MPRVCQVLQRRKRAGDVRGKRVRAAAVAHAAGTGEQCPRVDADEGGRQDPHRRQHAEPPADVRGNIERGNSLAAGDRPQRALLRVGDEDQAMPRALAAERGIQPAAHDEILRHRLCRPAGLGDHDEQRAMQIQSVQQRRDIRRVDVVEHVQARFPSTRLIAEEVPLRRPKCGAQRDRPECRSADAEHHDVGERRRAITLAQAAHEPRRLCVQRLVVGQVEEAEHAIGVQPGHAGMRVDEAFGSAIPLGRRDASLDRRRHHVGEVEVDHGEAVRW